MVPANWQTFHDPLGLYTLRLPPGWMAYGGVDTTTIGSSYGIDAGTISSSFGSESETGEEFMFATVSELGGGIQVLILGEPIKTAHEHQWNCLAAPGYNATFHGLPAYHKVVPPPSLQAHDWWNFTTENAAFQIEVEIQAAPHGLLQSTPTPLPAGQIATDQTEVNGILASFQPSDPKPLSC
jgi:hypothetical protein